MMKIEDYDGDNPYFSRKKPVIDNFIRAVVIKHGFLFLSFYSIKLEFDKSEKKATIGELSRCLKVNDNVILDKMKEFGSKNCITFKNEKDVNKMIDWINKTFKCKEFLNKL